MSRPRGDSKGSDGAPLVRENRSRFEFLYPLTLSNFRHRSLDLRSRLLLPFLQDYALSRSRTSSILSRHATMIHDGLELKARPQLHQVSRTSTNSSTRSPVVTASDLRTQLTAFSFQTIYPKRILQIQSTKSKARCRSASMSQSATASNAP